ncbi:MAG: hypothetical protein COB84_06605 [Rhodobacteraceae bacterium]|nr:MAG: hypothetical protein COB84_06605 [Paracoccaceae bacterium]
MDIRIFVGAHQTTSHSMTHILQQNAELLGQQGISYCSDAPLAVRQINATLKSITDGHDPQKAAQSLVQQLSGDQNSKRLLIVNPDIIGAATKPFDTELFYPQVDKLIQQLRNAFIGFDLKIFAATNNPASFIPASYSKSLMSAIFDPFQEYIDGADIQGYRWSSFIQRIQHDDRNHLTVWRTEDYNYIWRDVLQAFTGIANGQDFIGTSQHENTGLSLEGAQLMQRYILENPPRTKQGFDKTKTVFLERFPNSADALTGTDWSADLVQELTDLYADDWYYIERMNNVTTIQPRNFD